MAKTAKKRSSKNRTARNRPGPKPKRTVDERASQAALMARKRSAERDIGRIPKPANKSRRTRFEKDAARWLRHYIGTDADTFTYDFTPDQREIIDAVLHVMNNRGLQSIAAPRGDGKTMIVRGLIVYAICTGLIHFPVLISKSKGAAQESLLAVIKGYFEDSKPLNDDYPEICYPIQMLDRSPRRAAQQTYTTDSGEQKFSSFEWSGDSIVFPRIEGSRASGAVIRIRGADSAIRGLNVGPRPDFVLIDDPDDDESAASELQAEKRRRYIKQGVLGLGTMRKPVGAVMLTTIPAPGSVSDIFTDPKQEPAWRGRRIAMVKSWPHDEELWKRYMQLRQDGMDPDGETPATAAIEYLRENYDAMHEGAEVSNHAAFDTRHQVSAIQACYDIIADRGMVAFQTEYQNDPPEEARPQDSGITSAMVARRLNGLPQRICPRDTKYITIGIDLGQYRIHYTAIAWCNGAAGYVIDYGVKHVSRASGVTIDHAIMATLRELRDELVAEPFATEDGEPYDADLCYVDMGGASRDAAGNVDPHKELVYAFCAESGATWRPFKGESPYRSRKPARGLRIRHEAHESYQPADRTWLTLGNADFWKHWVHARFMSEPDEGSRRGTLTLWGDEPNAHRDSETGNYAKSIVAEVWRVQPFHEGKGSKEGWHKIHRENHYLDATYMACCGAATLGIRLMPDTRPPAKQNQQPRPKLTTPDGRPFFVLER